LCFGDIEDQWSAAVIIHDETVAGPHCGKGGFDLPPAGEIQSFHFHPIALGLQCVALQGKLIGGPF
jgi:hypothetical protein